jgi:hypothetical protein
MAAPNQGAYAGAKLTTNVEVKIISASIIHVLESIKIFSKALSRRLP